MVPVGLVTVAVEGVASHTRKQCYHMVQYMMSVHGVQVVEATSITEIMVEEVEDLLTSTSEILSRSVEQFQRMLKILQYVFGL